MNLRLSMAAALLTGLACTSAYADDTVTINVSGTLTKSPCSLTSSKTLTANFGSIRTDEIETASAIDIPVTLNRPANSSPNVSIKASGVYQSSTTYASTTKANLVYILTWKSDGTAANVTGTKRNLTNQSGAVNLGLTAKLYAITAQTEGSFTGSSVITLGSVRKISKYYFIATASGSL